MRPGPLNLITDVEGLRVGNAQEARLTDRPAPETGRPAVRCQGSALLSPAQGTSGTPPAVRRQLGTKKSAGSITPLAAAQSIRSWRISFCWL